MRRPVIMRRRILLSVFENFVFFATFAFTSEFINCSALAEGDGSVTSSKDAKFQGRIELNNLGKTGVIDTQSHYWSAIGTASYISGNMNKAEQAFAQALSEADNSKLSATQKALLMANAIQTNEKQVSRQVRNLHHQCRKYTQLFPNSVTVKCE